jgi:hypothetical protein
MIDNAKPLGAEPHTQRYGSTSPPRDTTLDIPAHSTWWLKPTGPRHRRQIPIWPTPTVARSQVANAFQAPVSRARPTATSSSPPSRVTHTPWRPDQTVRYGQHLRAAGIQIALDGSAPPRSAICLW